MHTIVTGTFPSIYQMYTIVILDHPRVWKKILSSERPNIPIFEEGYPIYQYLTHRIKRKLNLKAVNFPMSPL